MNVKPALILGGTGKTGRRVVERLRARRLPVLVGSRSASPRFDWVDPLTWPAALTGVHAVYVSYFPDLAAPGAAAAIQSFTDLAVRSGVRRLVLLAGRGEPEARQCEQFVRESGVEWTIVRASWFCQNFSESFLVESVVAGRVALPAGGAGEPFVDAEDIADVAAAALTGDGHAGKVYEVTGPRLLTFADATAEIARATGRAIEYEDVPLEAYARGLEQAGVPGEVINLITYLFGELLDGRNAWVGHGVERALGRPARDFSVYARDTAKSGAWATPAGRAAAGA